MIIPILMYHSIGSSNNLSVSTNNFDKQMSFMKKNNYKTISFKDLNNLNKGFKYFIITFDDGYEDVHDNALPIMKKYGFHSICYFVTSLIGQYNVWDLDQKNFNKLKLMDVDKISSWLNNGMDIGAHSATHQNLTTLDSIKKKIEIENPKKYFNDTFSINVESFSYPFGRYDEESLDLVKNNYNNAVTTHRSRYKIDKFHKHILPRIPINKSTNIFKFYLKIKTPYEDIKFN